MGNNLEMWVEISDSESDSNSQCSDDGYLGDCSDCDDLNEGNPEVIEDDLLMACSIHDGPYDS